MISILANGPAEAEYYSSPRRTSIFPNVTPPKRVKPTYDANGRVYIHNKPSKLMDPKELWHNILFRVKSASALNSALRAAGLAYKVELYTTSRTLAPSSYSLDIVDDHLSSLSPTDTAVAVVEQCNDIAIAEQRTSMRRRNTT